MILGTTRFHSHEGNGRRAEQAFTMVEIALALAVVAFALVAIIGVLPTGLQVQKDNREETIVNNDGAYLVEAIRSGNDRLGILTSNVYLISVNFNDGTADVFRNGNGQMFGHTVLGLLSTPAARGRLGVSNVTAWVRALNSTAIDTDPNAREVAFRYQLVSEIFPFTAFPPGLTNRLSTNQLAQINALQSNLLYELRLTMRWPLFNDNLNNPKAAKVGTRRRTFRGYALGPVVPRNAAPVDMEPRYFYFRPGTNYARLGN